MVDVTAWPKSEAEFKALSPEKQNEFVQQYQAFLVDITTWVDAVVLAQWTDVITPIAHTVQSFIERYGNNEEAE